MKDFYSRPFPEKKAPLSNIDIFSLDFETTGLDITNDRIVSIGSVVISAMEVELNTATHQLVNTNIDLPEQSVVIHQITDDEQNLGIAIPDALPRLLKQMSGKVLLAHNAQVEVGFLKRLCRELYQTDFMMPVIDTQRLAKRSFERKNRPFKPKQLRLFNLREAYGMPAYKSHNALMDAVATAELFLALVYKISPGDKAVLADFT